MQIWQLFILLRHPVTISVTVFPNPTNPPHRDMHTKFQYHRRFGKTCCNFRESAAVNVEIHIDMHVIVSVVPKSITFHHPHTLNTRGICYCSMTTFSGMKELLIGFGMHCELYEVKYKHLQILYSGAPLLSSFCFLNSLQSHFERQ